MSKNSGVKKLTQKTLINTQKGGVSEKIKKHKSDPH